MCCVQIPAGVAYPRSHHSTAGRNALKRSQTSAPGDIFLFLYLYIQLHLYIYLYPMQMSRYIERHRHLPQIIYHYAHRAAYTHLYIFLYSYLYRNLYARKTPVSLCHRLCLEIVALQRSSPRVVSLHPSRTDPTLSHAARRLLFLLPEDLGSARARRCIPTRPPAPTSCPSPRASPSTSSRRSRSGGEASSTGRWACSPPTTSRRTPLRPPPRRPPHSAEASRPPSAWPPRRRLPSASRPPLALPLPPRLRHPLLLVRRRVLRRAVCGLRVLLLVAPR